MKEQTCTTCKYNDTNYAKHPCRVCILMEGFTEWQPITTPPDELDRVAKELVEKFTDCVDNDLVEQKYQYGISKQAAIIHCELMLNLKQAYFNSDNLYSIFINHYTTLKQKIESL